MDDVQEPPLAGLRPRPRELALSAAWNGGLTRTVTTVEGQRVNVVFPGHWTHGFGPDFAEAMLEFDGCGMCSGSVEIHLRTSDWNRHGHHLDPRYNTVALHIVSRHDMPETRRPDGKLVPVAVLTVDDEVLFQIDTRLPDIWSQLGGTVCAENLASAHPERLVGAIQRLGDARLDERVRRFEGELTVSPPNNVLLGATLDAFGYSENRPAMAALHQRLRDTGAIEMINRTSLQERSEMTTCLLLGHAGFLPLSPSDAHVGGVSTDLQQRIETRWYALDPHTRQDTLPPTIWQRARTRPANHPVARLVSLACLISSTRAEVLPWLTGWLHERRDTGLAIEQLRALTIGTESPPIGSSRAVNLIASVFIPFGIAFAHHIDDDSLESAAIDL